MILFCLLTSGVHISQLQQELQAMKKQQELAEKERRLEQQQQQNQQEKEQERNRREQHVSSLLLRGKERSRESKSSPPAPCFTELVVSGCWGRDEWGLLKSESKFDITAGVENELKSH